MRKIHIVISFVLLLAAGSLAAWDGFTHVSAIAQGVGIRIEWQAKDEHDVKYYEIYRSRSEDDVFSGTRILRQAPLGERARYTYVDGIFGKASASGDFSFCYVVCAVLTNDKKKYSDIKQASLSSLGVRQQTWGSIKAMFR